MSISLLHFSQILLRELAKPAFSREELFLTMERLYANEKRAHSWGSGSKLMSMQDPKRGLSEPEPAAEAPPSGAEPIPEGSS